MFFFNFKHFLVGFDTALLEIVQIETLRKHDQHQTTIAFPVDCKQLAVCVHHRLLHILTI